MVTVAELHDRNYQRAKYLLVIEGLPYAYTDEIELAGTTYISGVTVKAGLEMPASLTIAEVNPRTGLLNRHDVTFTIHDTDDTLAAMFKSAWDPADLPEVLERLPPKAAGDTSITTLKKSSDTADTVDLAEKHVGLEYIDSTYARRSRYITPSDVPPGMDHPVVDGTENSTDHPSPDLSPVPVSSEAYSFAGRRVGLYRIIWDEDAETWPSWSDQYDSGSLLWVGTLKDRAELKGPRKWAIECRGPDSWTRKALNVSRSQRWSAIQPGVSLHDGTTQDTTDQTGCAIWFHKAHVLTVGGGASYDGRLFNQSGFSTNTDKATLLSELQTKIAEALASTNTTAAGDGSFEDVGSVGFQADHCWIQVDDTTDPVYYECRICLHLKTWHALGWNPVEQRALWGGNGTGGHPMAMQFFEAGETIHSSQMFSHYDDANAIPPGPGYWVGVVSTRPRWFFANGIGSEQDVSQNSKLLDNNGEKRIYEAMFPLGTVNLEAAGRQVIHLTPDQLAVQGQTVIYPGASTPGTPVVDSSTTPDTEADAMGYWLFRGVIARGDTTRPQDEGVEFEEYIQIARCAWKNQGMSIRPNTVYPSLYIEQWEDPRMFGLPYEPMRADWISGTGTQRVECVPMAVLGLPQIPLRMPDYAHMLIPRILVASGTGGQWTSTLLQAAGDNHPASATGDMYYAGDFEIADLGCGIPGSAVDVQSFKTVAERLEGGIDSELNWAKIGAVGPIQAEETIQGLLSARGWALSWRRDATDKHPRWGAWSIYKPISPADVEVVLTDDDKFGKAGKPMSWLARQELRYQAPVDRFVVNARGNVLESGTNYEYRQRAKDHGARLRTSNVELEINAPDLADQGAMGKDGPGWFTWTPKMQGLLSEAAEWYAGRHTVIEPKVWGAKGRLCGPGTVVRLTDPRSATPAGTYGLSNAVGRVLKQTFHPKENAYTLRILIQHDQLGQGNGLRHWAPMARMWAWDSGSNTAHCGGPWNGDWMGHGEGGSDVAGFVEPSWSSIGGTAKVQIIQSEDLETFPTSLRATADVSSVNTADHTIVLTNISGTIYRDTVKFVLLRPDDEQDSSCWVRTIYLPHTDSLGKHGGVQGYKLH